MDIKFGEKFTQIHLDEFIEKYWDRAKNIAPNERIIFDMQDIEWIALEEITFLFAWFRYLIGLHKSIFIKLPPLDKKATKRTQRLINLWNRWEIWKFVPYDPKINGFRYDKYFNIDSSINSVREKFIKSELFRFEQFDNNNIRILPFNEINVPDKNSLKIDTDKILNQNIYSLFNFDSRIETLLNYYTSNSIFENKAISHIITNELYFNVIHHAFPNDFESIKQCYSAINLKGKFDPEIELQKENRKRALFYADENKVSFEVALKNVIKVNPCTRKEAKDKVDWLVKNILPNGLLSELDPATLPFYEEKDQLKKGSYKFRNESFIEYTFLDFGLGITNTLREQFINDILNLGNDNIRSEFNQNSFNQNIDTQIIEYAFLLSTSRHPFGISLENNYLIPRGLYFLIDIVKRYQGMVVVRSGKGKVIYDFSDEDYEIKNTIRYSHNDNTLPNFQGTLISITLPAKTRKDVKQGAAKPSYRIPDKIESKKPIFNSLREIYAKISDDPKPYTKLFEEINKILDQYHKRNCLLIFDFLAFNVSNIDHKILFFLCTSPKINEVTSVVITNFKNLVLLNDTQAFIQEKISYAGSFNLVTKPIPVINSIVEVYWIGVANQEDENKLNELLNYTDYQVPLLDFKNRESNLGHSLLADKYGNVISLLPTVDLIYEYALFCGNDFRNIFLEDKESNKQAETNQIYLTAGGYFQMEYISLFEKLNDKKITKPLAEVFLNTLKYNFNNLKYDKIVSVTLSSQLIAKAIDESLKEQIYLSKRNVNTRPYLVRLASYYSFDDEIEFKNINQGDKVLVVNDVISTGNLMKRISVSIKRLNKDPDKEPAEIVGLLTVVDTRKTLTTEKEKKEEVPSINFNQISGLSEKKVVKLFDYPITKFKDNPKINLPKIETIRVNPILNSEISLDSKNSEEYKVAFKSKDFLKEFPSDYLYIGHFSHNYVHHSYFFNTIKFFQSKNGAYIGSRLLKKVYDIVRTKEIDTIPELNLISIRSKINLLKEYKNIISKKSIDALEKLDEITKSILIEIWSSTKEDFNIDFDKERLNETYIFYPFFSGIEEIQKKELAKIFEISQEKIIDLQRFDTIKGWRFIPVPKTVDKEIEGKSIIVLDDGSCTGDTIIQIIDSLCFVRVKNITVLSIVGRLEDFNREFFSRIKELKVKSKTIYLKDEMGDKILIDGRKIIDEQATKNEKIEGYSPVIPVNIYFGSNFHIPIYASTKVCPFCKEIETLIDYENNHPAPPYLAIEYIKQRLQKIELIHTFKLGSSCPSYFPEIRHSVNENDKFDLRTFYRVRDEIGKIDGYRFYKDYYNFFNELKKSPDRKRYLEAIIADCVHEIHLNETIKNQLPDVYFQLKQYISHIISRNSINDTFYNWENTLSSLVLFYLNICSDELFSDKLVSFINFIKTDNDSCCLFVFFLWEKHLEYRNKTNYDFPIYNFRDVFYSLLNNEVQDKENREPLYDDIIDIFKEFEYTSHSEVDFSFYKIKLYFQKEKKTNSKFPGQSQFYYTAHPSFYNRISPLLSDLDGLKSRLEDEEEEINFIPEEWEEKWNEVDALLKSRLIKHYETLSPCILKFDIFLEFNKYFSPDSEFFLSNLCRLICEKIKSQRWHYEIEVVNQILNALNYIIEEYVKPNSSLHNFFNYFLNFNPHTALTAIIGKEQFKPLIDNLKIDSYPSDIDIKDEVFNAHPIIITAILFELFQNELTHSNGSSIRIGLFKDNKYYTINYQQNKAVDRDKFFTKKETGIFYYCNYLEKHFGFKYQAFFNQEEFILDISIPLLKKYEYE